jgi:hypothetical protein
MSSVKEPDLRDMIKEASKSVCTSTIVVISLPLVSFNLFSLKIPENTEEEPDDGGDTQMKYFLSLVVQPKYRSINGKLLVRI